MNPVAGNRHPGGILNRGGMTLGALGFRQPRFHRHGGTNRRPAKSPIPGAAAVTDALARRSAARTIEIQPDHL